MSSQEIIRKSNFLIIFHWNINEMSYCYRISNFLLHWIWIKTWHNCLTGFYNNFTEFKDELELTFNLSFLIYRYYQKLQSQSHVSGYGNKCRYRWNSFFIINFLKISLSFDKNWLNFNYVTLLKETRENFSILSHSKLITKLNR